MRMRTIWSISAFLICCLHFGCAPLPHRNAGFPHGSLEQSLEGPESAIISAIESGELSVSEIATHDPEFLFKTINRKYERLSICLVRNGLPIDNRDLGDATPLIRAAEQGLSKLVKELIERGVDINAIDDDHYTALMMAAIGDLEESIRVNFGYSNRKPQPWKQKHYDDILRILLKAGADTQVADILGKTALDLARNGRRNTAVKILKRSASTNSIGTKLKD